MAGAGNVILFVVFFVGCVIWSGIYLTFASHYFLTTLTESSAGNDEVSFPSEGILDGWWKPLLMLWVLAAWVVPLGIVTGPLLAASPIAFGIVFGLLFLLIYPLSLFSVLYAQNWFMLLHPQVIGRLLRHTLAFVYVYLVTLILLTSAGTMLALMLGMSFLWMLPATLAIATTLLLYARHWGRLSWLALNFRAGPKRKKKRESTSPAPTSREQPASEGVDDVPEVDVETVEDAPALYAAVPLEESLPETIPLGEALGAATEHEPAEDEWATNKKPYAVVDDEVKAVVQPSAPAYATEIAEEDRPLELSRYYDEKARKEKEAEERKRAAEGKMPAPSGKRPSFQAALLRGVWEFMIYARTIPVWLNLILLTFVELGFLLLLRSFWPAIPD